MVGGRPFLLGWTVHSVNSETQHHIFIIVIKLYCTKMPGQYLWEEQVGGCKLTLGEAKRGKMMAWSLGESTCRHSAALDLIGYNNHATITMDASQSYIRSGLPHSSSSEPQRVVLLGNPQEGRTKVT